MKWSKFKKIVDLLLDGEDMNISSFHHIPDYLSGIKECVQIRKYGSDSATIIITNGENKIDNITTETKIIDI